ncbi:MAG: hypothetical protein GC192_09845 [Bacteroidetes bacterium]|nr:hypothetical protein [Bacteroidota bacterium]
MTKKLMFFIVFTALFFACQQDSKSNDYEKVDGNSIVPTGATSTDILTAAALEETDYLQRIKQSFVPLEQEYQKANGVVPGVGEVHVFVDKNYVLLIENTYKGSVYQSKVNLKNLNNAQGGMSLMPDNAPGEFPGLKIYVKDGKPGVEMLKDGKLVKEARELDIYLADRAGIERVTPAILQGLNVASGNLPE